MMTTKKYINSLYNETNTLKSVLIQKDTLLEIDKYCKDIKAPKKTLVIQEIFELGWITTKGRNMKKCNYMKTINKLNKELNDNKEYMSLSEEEKNKYFDTKFDLLIKVSE